MNTEREPISITTLVKEFVSSGIKLAVVLGLFVINEVQLAGLLLFLDNGMAIAKLIIDRRNVTPIAAPSLPEGTRVTVETPAGEPNRVMTL
jgi:hypothetical protein